MKTICALVIMLGSFLASGQSTELGFKIQLESHPKIDYKTNKIGVSTDLYSLPVGDLSAYWIKPALDYIPQWLYVKFNRHQFDISVNRFNFTYQRPYYNRDDASVLNNNQRFRVDEYAFRYQFYFTKKKLQPYVFAGAAYQSLAYYYTNYSWLEWKYVNVPDLDFSRYIKGHLIQANGGIGLMWNANPWSCYIQLGVPMMFWGNITDSALYKTISYDLADPQNPIAIPSQTSHFARTTSPSQWNGKLHSNYVQFGVQYNFLAKSEETKSAKTTFKNTDIRAFLAINYGTQNYGVGPFSLHLLLNNKIDLEMGYIQYLTVDDYHARRYINYNYLILSKVVRKKHWQFSGGIGYLRYANYRHLIALAQSELQYVFKYDFRLGVKLIKSFQSVNTRDFVKELHGYPVLLTLSIPVFNRKWIPEIPGVLGLDALKKK